MTCLHEEIKTWYFEDTNQPAGMWSCKSCGHKFFPLKLWVGLSEVDIDLYALDIGVTANKAPAWLVTYARDIEAKLREKNQ